MQKNQKSSTNIQLPTCILSSINRYYTILIFKNNDYAGKSNFTQILFAQTL